MSTATLIRPLRAKKIFNVDRHAKCSLGRSQEALKDYEAALAVPADTTAPVDVPTSGVPLKPAEGLAPDPAAPTAQELGITASHNPYAMLEAMDEDADRDAVRMD